MKKTILATVLAVELIAFPFSAIGQTTTNDPVFGTIALSLFKLPKDWKLVSVDYARSTPADVTLWFQNSKGEVFIVEGEYTTAGAFKKRSLGKILTQ